MSASHNVQPSDRTEIIHGSENVADAGLKFASNAKTKIDACMDYSRPALAFVRKTLADIKSNKDIHLRVLTEIIADPIVNN